MSEKRCPYCKAPYVELEGRCSECNAPFPWVADIDALKDEIKVREVNRGRATFTLIDEVFGAAKGGKPVSVAALKGFAFAWLFPRAVIVLGSVISGLVLVAQTVILANQNALFAKQNLAIERQTELLSSQTEAATLDRVERLRGRISAAVALVDRIERLSLMVSTVPDWKIECQFAGCQNTRVMDAMRELGKHKFKLSKTDETLGLRHEALLLANRVGAWQEIVKEWDPTWPEFSGATKAPTVEGQAQIHCSFPPDQARKVRSDFNRVSSFAYADRVWLSADVRWVAKNIMEFTGSFYSGGSAAEQIAMIDFDKSHVEIQQALAARLSVASEMCSQRIKRDQATVEELERSVVPAESASAASAASRPP